MKECESTHLNVKNYIQINYKHNTELHLIVLGCFENLTKPHLKEEEDPNFLHPSPIIPGQFCPGSYGEVVKIGL